LFCKKN